jgi:hypothetical protein
MVKITIYSKTTLLIYAGMRRPEPRNSDPDLNPNFLLKIHPGPHPWALLRDDVPVLI